MCQVALKVATGHTNQVYKVLTTVQHVEAQKELDMVTSVGEYNDIWCE